MSWTASRSTVRGGWAMFGGMVNGWRVGLSCFGGMALLVAAFWMGRATSAPEIAPALAERDDDTEALLAVLGAELEAERERGQELGAQVVWLQTQMAQVGQEAAAVPVQALEGEAPDEAKTTGKERNAAPHWFAEQELLDRGLPEGDVARLRVLFDEHEMERIALRHQAEREGWLNKPRFKNRMEQFQLGMREEIGDENYDLMLYATGRKNRVVMGELLKGSPAQEYGFEAGDVVVSYDAQRIFHGRELRHATTLGERGDWIVVDVLRENQIVRIRARRGPLGVKLRPARILPHPLW